MRRSLERRSRRARAAVSRLAYEAALAVVARAEGIDLEELTIQAGRRPSARITALRRQAIYLAVTAFDLPMRQAARAAGVDVAVVSKGLRITEDARDLPDVDRRLDHLAEQLRAAA